MTTNDKLKAIEQLLPKHASTLKNDFEYCKLVNTIKEIINNTKEKMIEMCKLLPIEQKERHDEL